MNIKPIKTMDDHKAALARIEQLWEAEVNTPEGDELEVLGTLVQAFEDVHFPIDPPNPIDAIRFRMEQLGLEDKDLVPFLGTRSRVTEILKCQRRLSLNMIRKLHKGLNIPLVSLVKEY